MLGKSTRRPVIGKIIKPDNSGHRNLYSDEIISSPKSPLDFKMRSPRGMKNCDMGGVGLGIVAALEKSGGGSGVEIPMKLILGSLNLNMNLNKSSVPIPIGSSSATRNCREEKVVEEDEEESESYTYVTCHNGPNKKSVTRVYCDHGGIVENELFENHQNHKSKNLGVFYESPPRFTDSKLLFPTSDFLSCCYLCRRKLQGKDIYMYRGEKAFCSTECREMQIVNEERKENCRRKASRGGRYGDQYLSISNGIEQEQLFFSPGITAS